MPLRARRLVAVLLSVAGLAALLLGAVTTNLPLGDSVEMARRFWSAGPRGRLLNAPGFARDAEFANDVLRRAAEWPLDADAVLSVGPLVPPERRERLRRQAAYLLAPRRVRIAPGQEADISLRPLFPAGRSR